MSLWICDHFLIIFFSLQLDSRRQHIFYIGQVFVPLYLVIAEIQNTPVEHAVWIAVVYVHDKTLHSCYAWLGSKRKENPVSVVVGLGHVASHLFPSLPEVEFSALGLSLP